MQQAAEQRAIEQAEGFAWLLGPQRFDAASDIIGQALWRYLQAEQLRGCDR